MVAVTTQYRQPRSTRRTPPRPHPRRPATFGVVPTASMITGAAVARGVVLDSVDHLVVGISSIPSVIGFVLAVVVFIYLMRGVEWLERIRSEAVFGMGIPVPPRACRTTPGSSAGRTRSGSTSAAPGSGRGPPSTTCGWSTTSRPPPPRSRCWRSPSWHRRRPSRCGAATPGPACRSSHPRWPGCWR